MTRWLSDDEQRAWRTFLAVQRRLPEALERQLTRDTGMPHTYYIVLAMLSEAPGRSLRMSELAEITSSSPSRLSHAVARLEERGLVSRRRAAEDGRGNVATLTEDGMATVRDNAPGHVEAVRHYVFDRIAADDLAVFERVCRTVLDAVADDGIRVLPAERVPGAPSS